MKQAMHERQTSSCQFRRYAGDKAAGDSVRCKYNRASNVRLSDRQPIYHFCQGVGRTAPQVEMEALAVGRLHFAKVPGWVVVGLWGMPLGLESVRTLRGVHGPVRGDRGP